MLVTENKVINAGKAHNYVKLNINSTCAYLLPETEQRIIYYSMCLTSVLVMPMNKPLICSLLCVCSACQLDEYIGCGIDRIELRAR